LTSAFLLFATVFSAAAEPRRVLLLNSFGRDFAPFGELAIKFREELVRQSPSSIDFYEASLESARFREGNSERPFVDYLGALFAGRSPNLVVAIGAPAARFAQQNRSQLVGIEIERAPL
jgi:hypothetical protein